MSATNARRGWELKAHAGRKHLLSSSRFRAGRDSAICPIASDFPFLNTLSRKPTEEPFSGLLFSPLVRKEEVLFVLVRRPLSDPDRSSLCVFRSRSSRGQAGIDGPRFIWSSKLCIEACSNEPYLNNSVNCSMIVIMRISTKYFVDHWDSQFERL